VLLDATYISCSILAVPYILLLLQAHYTLGANEGFASTHFPYVVAWEHGEKKDGQPSERAVAKQSLIRDDAEENYYRDKLKEYATRASLMMQQGRMAADKSDPMQEISELLMTGWCWDVDISGVHDGPWWGCQTGTTLL
jgi:hypothetical protein